MYQTAIHALPAPDQLPAGAGPDIPKDVKSLADAIDTKLTPYITVANSGALPAAGKAGRRARDTSTGDVYLDIGAAWVLEAPAAGNGISVTGRTVAVDLAATPGLEISGGKLRAAVDGTSVERTAGGVLGVKDGGITAAKVANALKPSAGAAGATEALRALGVIAGTAAAGDDARLPTATEKTRLSSITAYIATLLDDADAATARDTLGVTAPNQALSAAGILDVGVSGQKRAGRILAATDFTALLGLSQPIGLFNLSDLTNLGSGGALTNKGAVPFGKGITGAAAEAAVFAGSTAQALYISDTGAADPFRIKTGSFGCWFRTAKRGTIQALLSKRAAGALSYLVYVSAANVLQFYVAVDGATLTNVSGVTDVADDRWHFATCTYDGSVMRVYVDGALEASLPLAGTMFGGNGPFNIGAEFSENTALAQSPHFGRIDVAFVTGDVLTEEQIRLLMSVKTAHGLSVTPREVRTSLRRRKKGGPFVVGDFTATPKALYNFTGNLLTDAGSLGLGLANNNGAVSVAGADGQAGGAYQFVAGSLQYLSASDAGLPMGTASRSIGFWMKTRDLNGPAMVVYGNGVNDIKIYMAATGEIQATDNTNTVNGLAIVADGQWHFVVLTIDNAAGDGLKQKLYVDGRLVAGQTALVGTVSGGAGAFRIGRNTGGSALYYSGSIDGVFITDYTMAEDEILALFAKGSLAGSGVIVPTLDDADLQQIIQGFDATNVYTIADVRKKLSGRVNSDGTIAEAVGGEFRVVRGSVGGYTIYFPGDMFTSPPVVAITPVSGNVVGQAGGGTSRSAPVNTYNRSDGAGVDSGFQFTAEARGPIPLQDQLDLGVAL